MSGGREALALLLARRILTDAVDVQTKPTTAVRILAARVGELEQAIRAAVAVIDELATEETTGVQ
ncbi:hypothetical protein OHA61_34270 [Streptomyces sp. NBC_00885]|uniref:hypothetical protein n=1 Tax=Streptomyces sp. NBC_00885 TaxID=2975857 RepID=UPI00386C1CB3|nr:hypothetical protein OHA61_34270 [Streptomyces sp. NBC_00885]